jgi:hypothetical protein
VVKRKDAKPKPQAAWTEAEVQRLHRLIKEEIPLNYICDLLGRNLQDVTARLYELSSGKPPSTTAEGSRTSESRP